MRVLTHNNDETLFSHFFLKLHEKMIKFVRVGVVVAAIQSSHIVSSFQSNVSPIRTPSRVLGKPALGSTGLSMYSLGIQSSQKYDDSLRNKCSTKIMASSISLPSPKPSPASKIKAAFSTFKSKFKNDPVFFWRTLAVTFLSSLFAFQPFIDAQLVNFWSFLRTSPHLLAWCFRHDHWEWQVAIWAFFVWIHGFWICDRLVQKADAKGLVHPLKKYRLQDQFMANNFKTIQKKRKAKAESDPNFVLPTDFEEQKPPVTKQAKWHLGFWIFELPLYVLPLYIWDITIPRRAAKIAAWNVAPTTLQIVRDVLCGLMLYDFGFFMCHFLMHKIPFLYKFVHKKHHTTTEVRSSDIVRLSGIEEVVDVGISILALNYLKCHPVSRTIYNLIITFLLTELHSGFAFPWTPQFVVPFNVSTGSKGHHYHHRVGKHYYQKFFCTVDRLFGFIDKKTEKQGPDGAIA